MAYDLGAVARLTVTVTDADGAPAEPAGPPVVRLVVTTMDGRRIARIGIQRESDRPDAAAPGAAPARH
jgi:hypothetical protein